MFWREWDWEEWVWLGALLTVLALFIGLATSEAKLECEHPCLRSHQERLPRTVTICDERKP